MAIFRWSFRLILASLPLLSNPMPTHAAEFKVADNYTLLEGEIKSGDLEKLRRLFPTTGSAPLRLYLASPGGDLAEAMKIGRLVRSLKWPTTTPTALYSADETKRLAARHGVTDLTNFMCASACFFLFTAGIYRSADEGGAPKLGIHRPYLSQDDLKRLNSDQAIATAGQVRTTVEKYLKEMSVPPKYADQMFSVPKDAIRWISKEDFDADFDGFVPELKDWVDAQCGKRSDAEKAITKAIEHKAGSELTKAERIMSDALVKKYEEQLACEHDIRDDLILHAYESGAYQRLFRTP